MKEYKPINALGISPKDIDKYHMFLNELGSNSLGRLAKKHSIPMVCISLLEELCYIKKTNNGGYQVLVKSFEPIHARQLLLSQKEYYLERTKKRALIESKKIKENTGVKTTINQTSEKLFISSIYKRLEDDYTGYWEEYLSINGGAPKPEELYDVVRHFVDLADSYRSDAIDYMLLFSRLKDALKIDLEDYDTTVHEEVIINEIRCMVLLIEKIKKHFEEYG